MGHATKLNGQWRETGLPLGTTGLPPAGIDGVMGVLEAKEDATRERLMASETAVSELRGDIQANTDSITTLAASLAEIDSDLTAEVQLTAHLAKQVEGTDDKLKEHSDELELQSKLLLTISIVCSVLAVVACLQLFGVL
jgi:ABC-type transporter Mla subunit MlaD